MLWQKLLLIGLVLLAGCATGVSSACPTLFEYPIEVQAQAADELQTLPDPSAVGQMLGDYGVNRNEIRVCRGQKIKV